MHFLKRFGTPILVISALIGLSVLSLVSMGEGFKILVLRRDNIKILKRDGTTITFNLPWNPPKSDPPTETKVKALSPAAGGLLEAVAKVASVLLDNGGNLANDISQEANALTFTIPALIGSPTLDPGAAKVSDVLGQVNSEIDQATAVAGVALGAANSIVGSLVAAATVTPNVSITAAPALSSVISLLASRNSSSSPSSTKDPEEFLPQPALCKTCNFTRPTSALLFNITTAPALNLASTTATGTATVGSCPAANVTCPSATTETCTVTETWHSTHYAATATLYSFIAAFTVTCTETVSVCPSTNAYVIPKSPTPFPHSPPLIACANGALAKRQEDCPSLLQPSNTAIATTSQTATGPLFSPTITLHPCPNAGYSCAECPDGWFCPPPQTPAQICPCGFGWACAACSQGFFCVPGPTSGAGGPLSSVAAILGASTITTSSSVKASFTAQPPSLPSLASLASNTAIAVASITCADGSTVGLAKDCLNGVLGTSLRALTSSPASVITQATPLAGGAVGNAANILSAVNNNVNSALGNINGLPGDLASSIRSNVASALAAANNIIGNINPSGASLLSNAVGNAISTANGAASNLLPPATQAIANLAGNILPVENGIVSNVRGGIVPKATSIVGNVAGNVLSVGNAGVGNGLVPTAVVAAGNLLGNGGVFREALNQDNVVSQLTTFVSGKPTVHPVVRTPVNGVPTVIPVVDMVVNGVPTNFPVLIGAAGQLAKPSVGKKGKRRLVDENGILCGDLNGRMVCHN